MNGRWDSPSLRRLFDIKHWTIHLKAFLCRAGDRETLFGFQCPPSLASQTIISFGCPVFMIETKGLFYVDRQSHPNTQEVGMMKSRTNGLLVFIVAMVCLGMQACSSLGKPSLIQAAGMGDAGEVDRLISEGAPLDAETKAGVTALFMAAANGHEAIVSRLVEQGANPNIPIQKPFLHEDWSLAKGATPLMAALAGGHVPIAEYLVQHGAETGVADEKGVTPVTLAASRGSLQIVTAGTAKPVDGGIPALVAAAAGAQPEVVAALLKAGADPKATVAEDYTDGEVTVFAEGNALMAAAAAGDDKSLQLLLDAGADVNATSKNGTTALMAAAANGHLGAADLLIAQGADVNARTTETYTIGKHSVPKGSAALSGAAGAGHDEMVQLLISNGADVNGKDEETHIDALFLAASEGHAGVVDILIDSGADVYSETKMGTAFCAAEHYGHPDIVEKIANARSRVAEKTKEKKK